MARALHGMGNFVARRSRSGRPPGNNVAEAIRSISALQRWAGCEFCATASIWKRSIFVGFLWPGTTVRGSNDELFHLDSPRYHRASALLIYIPSPWVDISTITKWNARASQSKIDMEMCRISTLYFVNDVRNLVDVCEWSRQNSGIISNTIASGQVDEICSQLKIVPQRSSPDEDTASPDRPLQCRSSIIQICRAENVSSAAFSSKSNKKHEELPLRQRRNILNEHESTRVNISITEHKRKDNLWILSEKYRAILRKSSEDVTDGI
jgi:hypothetical protein